MRRLLPFLLAVLSLSACAPQAERIASAAAQPTTQREKPVWAFDASDIPVDPAYRFGRLDNGMRYVIRQNATPKGTALVRMEIAAGSLDEEENERGFAHFVEHMAFNGSTNVPEGEMVKLLEREGLAFGADTNASTSFERTTYMLDLPRNDPALLRTALTLMRETASELNFTPEAVARERGVILAERRERNTWQLRNLEAQMAFLNPGARYAQRLPIGRLEALEAATAEGLKAFWRRTYVPSKTTIIVVGDFAPEVIEAEIRARFASWQATPAPPQPSGGPIDPARSGETEMYLDPAMSERIIATRHGPWQDEPDTIAQRREGLLRQIGYAVLNRRLQRLTSREDPPFRDAGLGTGEAFRSGLSTNLVVDTVDGKWRRGLIAAALEYRRALRFGFTKAEIAEQVARLRTSLENEAASAATRSHSALLNSVFALLRDDTVPATPQGALERFSGFAARIVPKAVLAAMKREAVPLTNPLLRLQGRRAVEGGTAAIRAAWDEAMRQPVTRERSAAGGTFAYTSFGPQGQVVSDAAEPVLGIRTLRFANGTMLNLKRTDLETDRILVQLTIDGGDMLNTATAPLTTEMAGWLPAGGLGKHSQDELQSILAGRTVSLGFDSGADSFTAGAQTTPRDLELQLQVLAALVTDPGYRPEGQLRYLQATNNFFQQLRATPQSALSNAIGGILSDKDPRFTLQPVEAYRKLTFAQLKAGIADRLAKGAIEIALVGDFDEDQAIALVARMFGALPERESAFQPYAQNRERGFTSERTPRVIRHTGPADQALLRLTWKTRDDSDPLESVALSLLERLVRIRLTESLREQLGKTYIPSANSNPSRHWPGYGVFGAAASVGVSEVEPARKAMLAAVTRLRESPVSADELLRARQPMVETLDNALKNNRGWLSLAARAQSEADRIARFAAMKDRLLALTSADVQAVARRYLGEKDALEVLVLPETAAPTTAP
jgi:zinc protease